MLKVLLVEDDPIGGWAADKPCNSMAFLSWPWVQVEEAERALLAEDFGTVVTDMRLPGASGMELRAVVERDPGLPVIIITGDVTLAVESHAQWAIRLHTKPFSHRRFG